MSSIKLSPNASGTGEFTIAAPNSNTNRTLTLPDASGTFLTNSGTEAGAFSTLSVNSNNISAVNSLGFRNRIINGDCRVDQRNAGASVSITTATYTLDRFNCGIAQGSGHTCQRSTTAPAGFTNSLLITVGTGASPAAGNVSRIIQVIEGYNAADLGWGSASAQTVTLSFWVRSSLTGTFAGGLYNNAANRTYVFTYTINAANTWEQKSITITGDTSGTWLTDNGAGIIVNWDLGTGSTYQGTAGSWAAGAAWATSGSVKLAATSGATFYITGVQLEAGSVATPFERRDYGRELMMCQRYCYVQGGNSNGYPPFASGQIRSSTTALFYKAHPVAMRAAPSVSINSASNFIVDDAAGYVPTALTLDRYTDGGMMLAATTSSGPTAGRGAVLYGDAAGNARITVTSEL